MSYGDPQPSPCFRNNLPNSGKFDPKPESNCLFSPSIPQMQRTTSFKGTQFLPREFTPGNWAMMGYRGLAILAWQTFWTPVFAHIAPWGGIMFSWKCITVQLLFFEASFVAGVDLKYLVPQTSLQCLFLNFWKKSFWFFLWRRLTNTVYGHSNRSLFVGNCDKLHVQRHPFLLLPINIKKYGFFVWPWIYISMFVWFCCSTC